MMAAMQPVALRRGFRPAALLPVGCAIYFLILHRSPAYLAGSLVVLALYSGAWAAWERLPRPSLALASAGLVACGLSAWGLWQFLQMHDLLDIDQAVYSQALWNLRQGNLDFWFFDRHLFGIHSQYTLVAWIPVQLLFGEPGLKAGKMLCLLLAAWLLVRGMRGKREASAWIAAAFLLSPAIASQFFYGFHPEFLGAPLLVLALLAYRDGKLGAFLLHTALLAYTKETFTLAIGGILLVALIERRSWKWWLLPGLLCCALMALYWFAVVPRFAPKGNHLSFFIPSLSQIPSLWARPQVPFYVLHVALPFLPLLLAYPKRYLLLPLPLMAFYASFPDPFFMMMWGNYAFPLAILCCAGPVLEKEPAGRLDGRVLLACVVTSLLCYPLYRDVLSFPTGNLGRYRQVDRMVAMVPPSASVLVHGNFLARFASRREFSVIGNWNTKGRWNDVPREYFDYIAIDADFAPFWMPDREKVAREIRELSASPDWVREYGQDRLHLFRRKAP